MSGGSGGSEIKVGGRAWVGGASTVLPERSLEGFHV